MNERPSAGSECRSARTLLKDLWADGGLNDAAPDGGPSGEPRGAADARWSDGSGRDSGWHGLDSILRHIERCPTCRREADDLQQLGRSLRLGLDSLCGAIAETMDRDIEGTLQKIRDEWVDARFIRRARRPLRLVLWITFLAFTLLASVLLASAVYEALRGL